MLKLLKKNGKKQENENDHAEMNFLEHLEELRWHIIRSLIAIILVGIVVFISRPFVFDTIIFGPKNEWFPTYKLFGFKPADFDILPREMGESFFTHIKVSFILGLIVVFPYVFWEFWRFIKPGLYEKEKKAARGIVFICSSLFLLGVVFGYYIVAPFAVTFLGSYSVGLDAINSPSLASYVSTLTMCTLPMGLVFELPVIVYFLSKIGLVTAEGMKAYRRHAIIIILILAAIITPPDVVTQFLIGIPVYILYEFSILIAARVQKKVDSEES